MRNGNGASMRAGDGWSLKELPRDRLEELAFRALIEIQKVRELETSNQLLFAVLGGFLLGAALATGGFLTGAALR